MTALKTRVTQLLDWWKQTRIGRALARYGAANGALLAGGISYSALFSIFAALTIAFTVFMAVLGNDVELRDAALEALNEALPGVVDTGDGQGLLQRDQLVLTAGLSVAGIVAAVVLLNSATTVMAALRTGIRAMFGIVSPQESFAIAKLRDLGGFVCLAFSVILTSGLGIAAGAAGTWVLSLVHLDGSTAGTWLLRAVGLVVVLAVDMGVFLLLYRALAGVRLPRRDLLLGALVAGVAAGVIRLLGTTLVGSASANPLLAYFAAIVTLLLWVNIVVRVTLMVAAWTANPPAPPVIEKDMITHLHDAPNYVTVSEPETLEWDHDPKTGQIRAVKPEPEEDEYWGGLIGWVRRKWRALRS